MPVDMADAPQSMLRALRDNTSFPEAYAGVFTVQTGYEAQFSLLDLRLEEGEQLAGWKVGLTSRAMQKQQNVHEPCLGHLVGSGHLSSPARVAYDRLMAPGFESELCLRLARPLSGAVGLAAVRDAIDAVAPAIELVEKRGDFGADFPLALAGNAQQRYFVTGPFQPFNAGINLAEVAVEVVVNGRTEETATGAEVLGDPINSIVWLAEKLATFGRGLKAGKMIMSGSFTKQYPVVKGDAIEARFSGLGTASVEVY